MIYGVNMGEVTSSSLGFESIDSAEGLPLANDRSLSMMNVLNVDSKFVQDDWAENCELVEDDANQGEVCECLEWVEGSDESSATTVPLPDPLRQFRLKMEEEIRAGRLEITWKFDGIGPVVDSQKINQVYDWLKECSERQAGHVGPRNLRHYLCPDLE
ncbi:uncharacterized protein [Prorops nasuta]|uniref:uncharacterized protein n=1 Tax=Prorops nasuta TaxID=863751 RepID=UPI0034CE6904